MGGKFSKKGKYCTYKKTDKHTIQFRELDHFLYGHEVSLRKNKSHISHPSLQLDVPQIVPLRRVVSCVGLNPNSNENVNLPTKLSEISLVDYEEKMKVIKETMDETSSESIEDMEIMHNLEMISEDIRCTDNIEYLKELKAVLDSYSDDLNNFQPTKEKEINLKSKYHNIITKNKQEINNKLNKYITTSEDKIKLVIHNLKEPRLKLKTAKTIEELNEVKRNIEKQLIELNKISCDDDKTRQYKTKVIDKIKHYKETIHEKIDQLSKPNNNKHSVDSYNLIQEITEELNLLKQEIIDYFGTSYDDEYKSIVERLNNCHRMLKDIDAKSNIYLTSTIEQYEDNIKRLKEIFDKIILDNERDFRNDIEQISKIERKRDRRKKSTVIQFNYNCNNEDINKKLNTQVSTLSDLIDNIDNIGVEQIDFVDKGNESLNINLNIVQPENVAQITKEEIDGNIVTPYEDHPKKKYLRSMSTDTTASEYYECDDFPETDNETDDFAECFSSGGTPDFKLYPVEMPENGFKAIFGGPVNSDQEEKYEVANLENVILDDYFNGHAQVEACVEVNRNQAAEEQKEISLEQTTAENISFIQNLIINQLFLENEREQYVKEHYHELVGNFQNKISNILDTPIDEMKREDNNGFMDSYDNKIMCNENKSLTYNEEDNFQNEKYNDDFAFYNSDTSVKLNVDTIENSSALYENNYSSSEDSLESNEEDELNDSEYDEDLNSTNEVPIALQFKKVLRELKLKMSKKKRVNRNVKNSQHISNVTNDTEEQKEITKGIQNNNNISENNIKITEDIKMEKNIHDGRVEQKEFVEEISLIKVVDSLLDLNNENLIPENPQISINLYEDEEEIIHSFHCEELSEKINSDDSSESRQSINDRNINSSELQIETIDAENNMDLNERLEKFKCELGGIIQEQIEVKDGYIDLNNKSEDNIHNTDMLKTNDQYEIWEIPQQQQQEVELDNFEENNLYLAKDDIEKPSKEIGSNESINYLDNTYYDQKEVSDDTISNNSIPSASTQDDLSPSASENQRSIEPELSPTEISDEINDDVPDLPHCFGNNTISRGDILSSNKKLKVVEECVDELKEQINRFEGDKKDDDFKNLYDTLFDCMDILNVIKSTDVEIVNTKQDILNTVLKCIGELENKVKPPKKLNGIEET